MTKSSRTTAARLEQLEAEREVLQRLAPIQRPACPEHGWHPPGPGTNNYSALASLCPYCREERKRAEREAAAPEVKTIDFGKLPEGSVAAKLWDEARDMQARAGLVVAGSALEREILRTIDSDRADDLHELREIAADRRRANEAHWQRQLGWRGRRRKQKYEPHPARAGG
jgi:hypothetical protein